jgi:hypothetical protein
VLHAVINEAARSAAPSAKGHLRRFMRNPPHLRKQTPMWSMRLTGYFRHSG